MKTVLVIGCLFTLFASPASAQYASANDSTHAQAAHSSVHATRTHAHAMTHAPAFRDENGDGIDDRAHRHTSATPTAASPKHDAKVDCFIDADGDGINDNRCCGMGIAPTMTSTKHKGTQK
jgi:hypothetical protein